MLASPVYGEQPTRGRFHQVAAAEIHPGMAKQLLHAGNATDTPFVITAQSDIAGSSEIATVYAQQLMNLGLNVTVNPVTHATFFANTPESAKNSMITVLPIADRDWPASLQLTSYHRLNATLLSGQLPAGEWNLG